MKIACTILLGLMSPFISAQSLEIKPAMIQYTVDNGLPSNIIHDIYCDSIGLVWMATNVGLVRFDGDKFLTYNKSNGLADNDLLRIRGQQNKIWFATGNGDLTYYSDQKLNKVEGISPKAKRQNFTYSVFEDSQNRIWTSNANYEVSIIDSFKIRKSRKLQHIVPFLFEYNQNIYGLVQSEGLIKLNPIDLSTENVLPFRADYRQKFHLEKDFLTLLTQENELIKINLADLTIIYRVDLVKLIKYNPLIYAVKEFDNQYYLATSNGLIIIDKDKKWQHILKGYSLTSVSKDNEGGIWLGSMDNGCFNLPFNTANQINSSNKNGGELMFLKFINDVLYVSNDETLFIKSEDYITTIDISLIQSKVKDLVASGDSLIVIGNNGFGVVKNGYFKKIALMGNSGAIVKENLIIGTHRGTYRVPLVDIYQFNFDSIPYNVEKLKTKLNPLEILSFKTKKVLKINEDSIILGSKNGLYLFYRNTLDTIELTEKLLPHSIKACVYNGTGILLVVTESNKLYEYSFTSKQYRRILNNNSESKIHINDLAYDSINKIWLIASNQGINIYDKDKIIKLSSRIGLPSTAITKVAARNGTLYAISSKGIYNVNIKELLEYKKKPILKLERFYSSDQSTTTGYLETPYDKTDIFIKTVSSSIKHKVKYAYSINDEDWRFSESSLISLSHLAPGKYIIKIKAITENAIESNIIEVYVKVLPPYWFSWWFRTIIIIVISFSFYLFFKLKVLAYNKDVVKEILLLVVNKLKKRKRVEYKNVQDGAKTIFYLEDIIRIQGAREYVEIQTINRSILVKKTMKGLLAELNTLDKKNSFIQVHKSFIIRADKVEAYHYQFIKMMSDEKIPIGRTYRPKLKEFLSTL